MLAEAAHWEIASFFALVVLFEIWERLRPARSVSRLAELKLNVLSFAIAVLVAHFSRLAVDGMVDFASPAVVLAALEELRALPAWAKIALAFVVVDFILYWIHRAQHRFECGWRTHRWHHSAQELYWFSGFRTSFLHSFFYNIPQTVVPMHLFHLSPLEAGIGYSIGLFVQFWEHTNVNANIGWLKYILITPQYHRLHHAAAIRPSVNLAPTFCVWDRLFGTYMDPDKAPADYPLGLGEPIRARDVPRMLVGV